VSSGRGAVAPAGGQPGAAVTLSSSGWVKTPAAFCRGTGKLRPWRSPACGDGVPPGHRIRATFAVPSAYSG
jgi:hypothetical protein